MYTLNTTRFCPEAVSCNIKTQSLIGIELGVVIQVFWEALYREWIQFSFYFEGSHKDKKHSENMY